LNAVWNASSPSLPFLFIRRMDRSDKNHDVLLITGAHTPQQRTNRNDQKVAQVPKVAQIVQANFYVRLSRMLVWAFANDAFSAGMHEPALPVS
jgi:hypothetical protein